MRRGRKFGVIAAVIAAVAAFGVAPGAALAASPQDICRAIAAGTFNPANYSQADLAAWVAALGSDTTTQGYCSPLAVPPTPTLAGNGAAPAAQDVVNVPTRGVKGATKVKSSPSSVKPAATQRSAAPLATTRSTGTLPFTGAELAVFAIVGLALLGGGLLLRVTSRQRRTQA